MKIVITGISGQDGSHMADYLLQNTDAEIYGIIRQLSVPNHCNIEHLKGNPRVHLIEGDISDPHSMTGIIEKLKPDYFINFAANSFVKTSWDTPASVIQNNTMSVLHQLEAIRRFSPSTRYYQAGSSEEFGDIQYVPQDEKHPLRPRSPYGASKAAARHIVKVYRESYGLYAVCGWLFNHEGTRRGEQFVTRKITKGVAKIAKRLIWNKALSQYNTQLVGDFLPISPIELGNLEAKRDWSDSEDFVDGVWKMLNQIPGHVKDYVLSSNETHTIREFIELAFAAAGINIIKNDAGGYSLDNGTPVVVINPEFYRPAEVDLLWGDSNNIRKDLGWKPRSTFKDLVVKMVNNDIRLT